MATAAAAATAQNVVERDDCFVIFIKLLVVLSVVKRLKDFFLAFKINFRDRKMYAADRRSRSLVYSFALEGCHCSTLVDGCSETEGVMMSDVTLHCQQSDCDFFF